MEFFQIDVFADEPYEGNPLAVFPNAGDLSDEQMQLIAREMNLSETIFVTSIGTDEYTVRIFTPAAELPFAGHPTIGCAWLLSRLRLLKADEFGQRSAAGLTAIRKLGEDFWFERTGSVVDREPDVTGLARALGLQTDDLELAWDGTVLHPAIADAGVTQMMVPIRDVETLRSLAPPPPFNSERFSGAYCFTRTADGIRARGFFADVGVYEDPATGSAAAGLGLYLGHHVGRVEMDITQGVEMGRRSVIRMQARDGAVSIGGSCRQILKGTVEALP